jgi:hypothetical protein
MRFFATRGASPGDYAARLRLICCNSMETAEFD